MWKKQANNSDTDLITVCIRNWTLRWSWDAA